MFKGLPGISGNLQSLFLRNAQMWIKLQEMNGKQDIVYPVYANPVQGICPPASIAPFLQTTLNSHGFSKKIHRIPFRDTFPVRMFINHGCDITSR
jgi:hypothetical protein